MTTKEMASQSDLEELRERGLVAYSPFATKCMAAVAFLLCVAILWRSWADTTSLVSQFITYGGDVPAKSCGPCIALKNRFFGLLLVIPGAMLLTSLVIGLFQTRFLFYWGNLGFDLARLNKAKSYSLEAVTVRILKAFIAGILIIAAWLGILSVSLGAIAGLLNGTKANFLAWPQYAARTSLPISAFVLALIGFFCRVTARIVFRYVHKDSHSTSSRDLYQDE